MSTTRLPEQTDILIVGAGPAGLAHALSLLHQGVSTTSITIVDALAEGLNTSRAVGIAPYTLEILDGLSIADEMIHAGIRSVSTSFRQGDEIIARVDLTKVASKFQFALLLQQDETERILGGRLQASGVSIIRPKKVVGITGLRDMIKHVQFESGEVVKARYVIGADGVHSTIRQLSGIKYVDPSNPNATDEDILLQLTLADVTYTATKLPHDQAALYISPEGIVVWAPLSNGHARVIASVVDTEEIPKEPSLEWYQALVDSRHVGDLKLNSVFWASRTRVRSRLAENFVISATDEEGAIVLIGDAAHSHSPAGGQGMNLGIVDGVKLGEAIKKHMETKDPDVFSAYEPLRRKWALEVIALSERLTRLAQLTGWQARLLSWVVWGMFKVPAVQWRFATTLSGIHRR